jgi:hypothetical protein
MKVSRNEMNAALMRAYEGAAYAIGDYEEAAELTTWLEMCGLGGFADTRFPLPTPQQLPHIDYESNGIAVIDANAASVCQYGSLAAHLACTLANREGLATVHLANCTNPKLILGSLAKIACKGFYLSAYWQQNSVQHGASFDNGSAYPDYWVLTAEESGSAASLSTITILCTRRAGLLANTTRPLSFKPENELQLTSAAILASRYDSALNQGIEVDPDQWAELNRAAWPILVPTSQQSNQGAGPG